MQNTEITYLSEHSTMPTCGDQMLTYTGLEATFAAKQKPFKDGLT